MATEFIDLVPAQYLSDSQSELFVVTPSDTATVRGIIDSCTVTNVSSSPVTFNINLAPSGSSAGSSNLLIKEKSLQPGESYLCPELLGQVLNENESISGLASSADWLVIKVSGRIITS